MNYGLNSGMIFANPELIEVALAHVDKGEVQSSYTPADCIEPRRPMMGWWREHTHRAASSNVSASVTNHIVPIR